MTTTPHLTLQQLLDRVGIVINNASNLCDVWVVAETSDLRTSNGHCYMELLQKDDSGKVLARMRANIWASQWRGIVARFTAATGAAPATGMKILAHASVKFSAAYGISLNISDIDPNFTLGEAARRRNEIILRLQKEGLTTINRAVKLNIPTQRIAVISAQGAAGFGDFVNHLFTNDANLMFDVHLFPAMMQGEQTVASVMAALQSIREQADDFDAVVIIRGGGSSSDLASFDDYTLAKAIAMFPLPVIVGIGHDRDISVLDYVAFKYVKTPTAAAEWFINRGKAIMESLNRAANMIHMSAKNIIAVNSQRLAQITGALPGIVALNLSRRQTALGNIATAVANNVALQLTNRRHRLDNLANLVEALSPQSALKRGFSLTIGPDGKTLRDADNVPINTAIKTILYKGTLTSITK